MSSDTAEGEEHAVSAAAEDEAAGLATSSSAPTQPVACQHDPSSSTEQAGDSFDGRCAFGMLLTYSCSAMLAIHIQK